MGFIITVGVIVIAISCLTIEVKLRKANEQNKEIFELLKQLNEINTSSSPIGCLSKGYVKGKGCFFTKRYYANYPTCRIG